MCCHGSGGGGMIVSCWCLLGVSVGTASCVFGWTWLAADNADADNDDDDAYDPKNGVNAAFHHHPHPSFK
eukprot:7067925-Ditylum_brightwellii.AAC.1